jgi:HAD superfamily hydrolase (TIGR01509 family)
MSGTAFDPPVRGVIFDMDGTLVESALDFDRIRAEARVPEGEPILEFLEGAAEPDRRRVLEVLHRHERRAASESRLRDGVGEVLDELSRRGLRTALLTRNSADSVRTVLERFGLRLDCWVSRETARPKPSPEPVLAIAARLGLAPEEMLMVGDYVFDVQAGRAAGARTAFLRVAGGIETPAEADLVIHDLRELLAALPGAGDGEDSP